ncbi:MAG: hypothetical protein ACK50A_17130 [Sphingobacteriaceae bacterium]|jgi:hypothetical protein
MKKFNDLCIAYTKAKSEFDEYLITCEIVAHEIWNAIINYNEIPPTQIALYMVDEMGNCYKSAETLSKTMVLREDGFFEFGIGITFYASPSTYPHETVVVSVNVAKDIENIYKAKLGADGKIFEINLSNIKDIERFTDSIMDSIEGQYQTGLTNMVSKNTFRRIGFK